jgi:uncharacterized protein YlzI (FlbEa/FlbD family)
MRSNLILLISLLTVSVCSYGQDTTQLKRAAYKLTVAVDKKNFYEEDIKESPYVLPDNTIQLYPGEKIYVEIEQENGVIKRMTAVKEIKNPSTTITISLTQSVKKKVHEITMLQVSNPFATQLSYKAKIFLLNQKKWVDTNVYPVEPQLAGFETWPDIITSVALGNWTLQAK